MVGSRNPFFELPIKGGVRANLQKKKKEGKVK